VRRALQHIGNGQAAQAHLEDFVLEAEAVALRAAQIDIGQKLHFHAFKAFALAAFAAASGHVEGKVPGRVAARLGRRSLGKELAERIEQFGVGQQVGPRGAPDGLLIHHHDLLEMLRALQPVAASRCVPGFAHQAQPGAVEGLVHQRALAGAGNAAHPHQQPEREADRDVLQIVRARAFHHQSPVPVGTRRRLRTGSLRRPLK